MSLNTNELRITHIKTDKTILTKYLDKLNGITKEAFNYPLYPNKYARIIVMIHHKDELIASGCIMDACAIYNVCIDKYYRGKGISYLLMKNILNLIKENPHIYYAYTNSKNPISQHVFEKMGFEEFALHGEEDRKHYKYDLSKL